MRDDGVHVAGMDVSERDGSLVVRVEVRNPTARTHYAISHPRSVVYEAATRRLSLGLWVDAAREARVGGGLFVRPHFAAIEPESARVIEVALPRVLYTLAAAQSGRGLAAAPVPAHEAVEVEVTLAVNDVPFYPDRRAPDQGVVSREQAEAKPAAGSLLASAAAWCRTRLVVVGPGPSRRGR